MTTASDIADKRVSTATARAALRGITLHVIEADNGHPLFVASMHALTRSFDSIEGVERWLDKIEGKAA